MTDIILTEVKNGLGIITLNSPRNLNSIGLEMANEIIHQLDAWKDDHDVQCIFLQGNEKAFCAGGDVRQLYKTLKDNAPGTIAPAALEFFIKEYTMDYTIHNYNKPIIAWGDAIVMGGGIGMLIGASHRFVTEKSLLAMPEITIGLYPDVAGTWFLNRMPEGWGYYFGLTGARMNGADALYLGIADYYVSSDLKTTILQKLMSQNWSQNSQDNKNILDTLLKNHSTTDAISPVKDRHHFAIKLSKINSVLEFKTLLESQSLHDEWVQAGRKNFNAGSPTSAMVIFEQLKRGKNLSLKQVFCSELNLSVHFSMHTDFPEGVRALLIDKDQKPNWRPATLEAVSISSVESYFTPIWGPLEHPLKSL